MSESTRDGVRESLATRKAAMRGRIVALPRPVKILLMALFVLLIYACRC